MKWKVKLHNISAILLSIVVLVLASDRNRLEDTLKQHETFQMSAVYDYKTGTMFYKDEKAGICFVETLEKQGLNLMNSVIIPEDKELHYLQASRLKLHEEVFNYTLAKAFCGQFPIYKIPKLLHFLSEEIPSNYLQRRKRSMGDRSYNSYPDQYFPQQGPASQTQIQGQVTGQGFFSGQAQSQQSGASQSQVQLSGMGILGSVSSSAGNAQAQIALGSGDGSGQAGSSGRGPSNSQVQVNLGQEGRGSMASASVLSGQGSQFGSHGNYESRGWTPGNGQFNKVIQSGHGVTGGQHDPTRGAGTSGQSGYGFGAENLDLGHGQAKPLSQYPGYSQIDAERQQQGGYESSRQYKGYRTGSGETRRHGIDNLFQIYPSQTGQEQGGYQTGHQLGQVTYPGATATHTGRQVTGNGYAVQPITGSQSATSDRNLFLGSPRQQSGESGHQIGGLSHQLRGSGSHLGESSQQSGSSGQQLTSGLSRETTGISQPSTENGYLGNVINPAGASGLAPSRGAQTSSTASQRTNGYQQYGSNGHSSSYGRGIYSPQQQQQQVPSYAGGSLPQAFASSYGGGQAQAQTVYLGPGTSAFYSPGQASYGTSSYPSASGNGNGARRQYATYDSSPQARGASHGYGTNGYRQATTYTSNPPASGHIDQSRSTPDGFVRPYGSSTGNTNQPIRQNSVNGYATPSQQISGYRVNVDRPDHNEVTQPPFTNTVPISSTDRIPSTGYQPVHGTSQEHSIPASSHGSSLGQAGAPGYQVPYGSRGQSQHPVYQQSGQSGHPGTISGFLQRPQEQSGYSPNYGISQTSSHDTGSHQRCTMITFTCTIIIESNGRAKICRPNGGQANGNGAAPTQNKQQGAGGICCC